MTVHLQADNRKVNHDIQSLRDSTLFTLNVYYPTKRQRRQLLEITESLLNLQSSVEEKTPSLLPLDCTQYTIRRLNTEETYKRKTRVDPYTPLTWSFLTSQKPWLRYHTTECSMTLMKFAISCKISKLIIKKEQGRRKVLT